MPPVRARAPRSAPRWAQSGRAARRSVPSHKNSGQVDRRPVSRSLSPARALFSSPSPVDGSSALTRAECGNVSNVRVASTPETSPPFIIKIVKSDHPVHANVGYVNVCNNSEYLPTHPPGDSHQSLQQLCKKVGGRQQRRVSTVPVMYCFTPTVLAALQPVATCGRRHL